MNTAIAILGATGAGKSSFIQTLTGQNVPLSHGLESSTTSITPYTCQLSDDNNKTLTVLDTPGLDGGELSDADIIQSILTFVDEHNTSLAGILYLHRISDPRMGGQASRALNTFRALTNSASFGKVVLVTTMWDVVEPTIGEKREAALKGTYWRSMLSSGARMGRFTNTHDSALDIVCPIQPSGPPAPVNSTREQLPTPASQPQSQPQLQPQPETRRPRPERRFRSKAPYLYVKELLFPATCIAKAAIGLTVDLTEWAVIDRTTCSIGPDHFKPDRLGDEASQPLTPLSGDPAIQSAL